MKKVYFLATAFAFAFAGVNAQAPAKRSITGFPSQAPSIVNSAERADGDTLFFFDGNGFYITDAADQTDFDYTNDDFDGLTPNNSGGPTEFAFYYSVDANDFMAGDVDSAFYMAATSWFNPAGQADNWFGFGPITIPAAGGEFSWYNKSNPGYTDGYKVYISTVGRTLYTDIDPATDVAVYTQNDDNSTPPATDTIWANHTVSLGAYAGQRVYIGFHHTANDMDVMYLDHFLITEKNNAGTSISNNAIEFAVAQNQPNPAKGFSNVVYSLGSTEKVALKVYDVTGKEVIAVNEGTKPAGKHSINLNLTGLNSGVYYYTLTAGNNNVTKKMVILE